MGDTFDYTFQDMVAVDLVPNNEFYPRLLNHLGLKNWLPIVIEGEVKDPSQGSKPEQSEFGLQSLRKQTPCTKYRK